MKSCCNGTLAMSTQGAAQSIRPSILSTLKRWYTNIHNRHALARLDERLLRDCGITESDRQLEISKPFWR
ncbi:DUF1127 domain-containing protein [Pseudomonas fluorescens]|uniref:DUF1127 domain-containing protein n=1 Tax=Pseudomonas fluorescens TaxID=294 RepID=UPI001930906F|nr:DUF1127 domain-containing protein [Pseudomonas fluorescens]MBD8089056.1 DUF1127 domain-containing protein [Pseudomonas fluorescens]